MWRIRLILLLLGVLLAVGVVGAQEEEIIISYSNTYVSDNTAILADSFIEELRGQLLEFDIEISLIHHFDIRDIPETSLVDLSFSEVFNSERVIIDTSVGVWTDTEILHEISPVLVSELGIGSRISDEDSFILTKGIILYALGRNLEALAVLEDINLPEDVVDRARIEHLLGNLYLAEGNYEAAIEHLEYATSVLVIYNYRSLINLAWAYLANGEAENAIEAITEFVEIDLGNGWQGTVYLLKNRAQIYALAFDYDSAIADMDEAIALAEENAVDNTSLAELYTIRGQIIFLIYEWDRVLADFNHAIELDPNYAPAYFQRGVLYYTMTQRENALADFEHYLELEPDGLYAEEASTYIESIHTELEALGG
jgi:tetratricopeptide (TPR) repeat protein